MRKPHPWSKAIKADDESERGEDLNLDDAYDELFRLLLCTFQYTWDMTFEMLWIWVAQLKF